VTLQIDADDPAVINYQGRPVGRMDFKNGVTKVSLNLAYECSDFEEAIVPLSLLAIGLSRINQQRQDDPAALNIATQDSDIAQEFAVARFLIERTIKQGGSVWVFHKTDVDTWPSILHGHEYDKNLKLDALTGDIFDVATRQRCATLTAKKLKVIQDELRQSKDFADRVALHLGAPP
jgi:hypothetical protein